MSREAHLLGLLWREATQPSRNAATLAHNIRLAFRFLETPWDDKAKRIIGALITLNAGPMRTTIWAALFQQLREAHSPAIKIYILKQFANVCWTVPTAQAQNALRAFAHEVRPLLADTQVVANVTFQSSFATIIRFFSFFAEKSLSDELFDILYQHLKKWKQADSVRAAAAVIATMANENPYSPSPVQLIRRAKYDLDSFSLAVLVDTLISFQDAPGRILDEVRIAAFCAEVDEILATILAAPLEKEKVIPPCVSAYRRLKKIRPSWEPVAGDPFTAFVFHTLSQANVSKLLLCPLLRFLGETSCSWSQNPIILWRLTGSSDPFVRADAYTALASTTPAMGAPDQRLVMADLMERLHFAIDEKCSYTTVAILKFVRILLPHAHFPPSTKEVYLSKLVHLCRRHGKGLHHDAPAQLELLNVFLCTNVAPDALAVFVLELFLWSPDRAVAKKAFSVLCHFSMHTFLDSRVQTSGQFIDDENYFEASIQMAQEEPFEDELLPLIRLHRAKGLTACIYKRLCTLAECAPKTFSSYIIVCDAVKELYGADIRCPARNIYFHHTMLCLLSQLLLLEESMPSDAYVSLVQACAVCLQGNEVDLCENAYLLSSLVQHSWGVIVACATALFPTYTPASFSPSYRFFRHDSVSQACYSLIYSCRDIALSNEVPIYQSAFHEILACNTFLFTSCASLLRDAPIFLAELMESMGSLLECCTILSSCVPKSVLRLLTAVLDVAATALPLHSEGGGTTQGFLTPIARMCKGIVKQVIEMDLVLCCTEVCSFLLLFLWHDEKFEVFLFGELIAGSWSLIGELFSFCERLAIRLQSDSDAETLVAVLNLLSALCDSVYSPQISRVLSRRSLEEMLEALRSMHSFGQRRHCMDAISHIIAALLTESIEQKLDKCFSEDSAGLDFFDSMDRFVELWNASDFQGQAHLKAAMTSSCGVQKLVCAAAVDAECIPKAVEAAVSTSASREVLDVLLLIVTEAKSETLPPILFAVADAAFGDNDDVVKAIICSYRWGWYAGPQTIQMLLNGAWRTADTQLSRYLKLICGDLQRSRSARDLGTAKCLPALDGYATSSSFWQSFVGQASVEILQHETETSFFQIRVAEVLRLGGTSALGPLRSLCDQESSFTSAFCPSNIRLLASLIASGVDFKGSSWNPLSLLRLLQLLVTIAKESPVESELSEWLQLCCWLLFDCVRRLSDPQELKDAARSQQLTKNTPSAELVPLFVQLSNLLLCADARTSGDVAHRVVRYAVQNATLFSMGATSERLFWMMVRHCICEVWEVIAAESVASMQDPEIVSFLCRAHVQVGLPLSVQRDVNAAFMPQLLSFGTTDACLEEDSLRYIAWLVSNFAVADVLSSTRYAPSLLLNAPILTDAAGIDEKCSNRRAVERLPNGEWNFGQSDVHSFCAAARHSAARLAEKVLSNATGATLSSVLDALRVLSKLAHFLPAAANHAAQQSSNDIGLQQLYRIALDFAERFSLLSEDAFLDPPRHCLNYLLGELPREKRAHSITDALCLNSVVSLLSKLLQAWLGENAGRSAPPAQLPCTLALYLPYLLRCDLPSYVCALECLRLLSLRGAAPEVKAVYDVALPRLTEDLVDAGCRTGVDCFWYEVLVDCLGRVPGALADVGGQLTRRIWEGLWRCAASKELSCNQRLLECVQQALRQVIKHVERKSAQWELCRLVLLDSDLQRRHVRLMPVPAHVVLIESHDKAFFWLVQDLQERTWRLQLLQTQSAFVQDSAHALDPDSIRSLVFEFEKAVLSDRELPDKRGEFLAGEGGACIVAERVHDSLFSTTDAALVALNHFHFFGVNQRRTVLHELAKMMVRDSKESQTSVATPPSWAEVYFDILYERAAWHDEGLWVVCALAIVSLGKTELCWSKTVLASLIPASSSAWKRELMRRVGQRARIGGVQGEARQFFADASERLSALQASPPLWKRELLAAVQLVFS
ncbi:hypothetical protein LSCM1_02379 [Leishmania martiniquensis]|uniref:Uncharacterized protein n=1 Tax=Leishmania martiniquensis TaxID=1580590 RepID=A0A836GA99_9TRYP|nr:hypothetical protein LSCM1_02379 [Leishmania martiniquensis]